MRVPPEQHHQHASPIPFTATPLTRTRVRPSTLKWYTPYPLQYITTVAANHPLPQDPTKSFIIIQSNLPGGGYGPNSLADLHLEGTTRRLNRTHSTVPPSAGYNIYSVGGRKSSQTLDAEMFTVFDCDDTSCRWQFHLESMPLVPSYTPEAAPPAPLSHHMPSQTGQPLLCLLQASASVLFWLCHLLGPRAHR